MLLPPEVSPAFAAFLVAASFVTSALTAALSIGGGLMLLAVMASGLPAATVIPVHGVVQLGSNAGRAWVQRAHVDWRLTAWFGAGGLVGAVVGGASFAAVPDAPLKIAIGAFVLFMVWGPKPRALGASLWAMFGGGAIGGVLTMFFGATGPFTAAFLSARRLDRLTQTATFATCMSVQHVLKVIAFGFLGFAFGAWALLIAAMIASGFLGTLVGTRILHALPERTFQIALRAVLSALALNLIWGGVSALAA